MLIPPMINERVAIHFAHRVGALVVTLLAIALTAVDLYGCAPAFAADAARDRLDCGRWRSRSRSART